MIRRLGFWPCLVVIALVSLALRILGLDWDKGFYLHPDERYVVWVTSDMRWPESIGQFFNSATSPLNPYNTQHNTFVYGTFPSFLVKAIAGLVGKDSYGEMYLVGRATNAVFDTGTVVLTAMLGRRLFNTTAGLLAGLLLAFTPLFLQSAHFFTVDTIAVFFTIAAFWCALRSWDRSSIAWMAVAGIMVGLAGASKPNYLISLAFIALPALELVRTRGWRSLVPGLREHIYPALPAAFIGGFAAFWTFRLAQPYAFSGPRWWNISLNQVWVDDLTYWRAVQAGLVDMKPSIQWIERTPVVYILQNMVMWGMGAALGLIAIVALGVAVWRLIRSVRWPSWWWLGIVGWCVGSIAMYGTGIAQNQRYLMHIYPFLIILAAGFLIELHRHLERKWIAQLLTTTVVVYTVMFGLAFSSLYVRPITRIEASEWIYENVPAGSMISNEYWDDALPMPLPGQDRNRYTGMTLDLYADEAENNNKVVTLVGQVSQVDYIVLSSNRVIDSVVRQPERYPVAVRFYEMLLSGELGFEPVAHFHQGPELFGIEWDDRSAEESLTVYEHPEVRIFVKTENYDAQFVHDELAKAWGTGGYHYIPGDPLPNQMLMSESDVTALNEQGSWKEQSGFRWLQEQPLIGLWLVMQIIGLAAWPLTWRAFRNLPDMGWMLAKGIGLIGMSASTLALVSWRGLPFDRSTILLSIVLLAAIGLATNRCIWDEFRYKLRKQWPVILAGELLFLGVFLAMALMRSMQAVQPDHNLMQLTGLMRSVTLPPMDPWLSGGLLHTYWAGLILWASIAKVLSIEPVVAANLILVGLVATLAGVIWSMVSAVGRSWLGVLTSLVAAFGSSFAFGAGVAPLTLDSSPDIVVLANALIVTVFVHSLIGRARQSIIRLLVLGLVFGAMMVSSSWGFVVGIGLLALGLAIDEWLKRSPDDPWWPSVRKFTLELVSIGGVGMIVWYPALSAHTATARNLVSPSLWSLAVMRNHIGLILLMAVLITVGVGAVTVLSALMEEGVPGVVVAGIALSSVIALLVLSWWFDSTLLLLLLISFLAVTAAWHWLHDRVLLWSAGLVLISCVVLAAAQTRPFHPDPAGDSAATQLLPISWLLLVLAVGFAYARSHKLMPANAKVPAVIAAAIVSISFLVPTFDHLRQGDWEQSSLAQPRILASDGEINASRWLLDTVEGVPVILNGDGPGIDTSGTISALTGFPTVLGSNQVERNMRPGWERMVEHRTSDVVTIYTGIRDWQMVSPLIAEYDIRYIVVSDEERMRFGNIDDVFAIAESDGHLELVFEYDDVSIYRVVARPQDPED